MSPAGVTQDLFPYVVGLADDALVLGHRLSEWSGKAPTLEEDLALSNLALDLIGQARLLYAYAGEIEGRGRGEDDLAYFRNADEYRNIPLVELPNGDFAVTILRQLLYAAFMHPYFAAASRSTDARLAEIAAKAQKEMAYHVRHAAEWVIRLGDGTDESHARVSAALPGLWLHVGALVGTSAAEAHLVARGIAPDRTVVAREWQRTVATVLSEATLDMPDVTSLVVEARDRKDKPHLIALLADMQSLARQHPGVTW